VASDRPACRYGSCVAAWQRVFLFTRPRLLAGGGR